jgi:RING finger protein 113A
MGATAELEIDTSKEMDGRAMREQVLKQAIDRADGFEDDKKYRGTNAYVDYRAGFRREQTISSEKGRGAHGPMRAATNIRSTFVMDYKPDICKDYKQTGFCGWGDACKFLHDRGDYKQGWQLDKDWEQKEQARKAAEARMAKLGEDGVAEESDEEYVNDIPESCAICDTSWLEAKFPVATACGHFFCERCALQHNAKQTTCFTCDKETGGTFNAAKEIIKRVKECKATGRAWGMRQKKEKRADDKAQSNQAGWVLG